ncbi:unnamed protein product, partial [marine sediment metagenome]
EEVSEMVTKSPWEKVPKGEAKRLRQVARTGLVKGKANHVKIK